jgi:pimeloyl-ACP methyl ester carboxylesterase
VLQRVEKPSLFNYVEAATLHYYVRWESGATSSLAGKPFDYVVAIPDNVRYPAPVGLHLHAWAGTLNDGYGWWFNASKGAVLVATNQDPYDWWTGYHEAIGTDNPPKSDAEWRAGVVKPYTQRRVLAFLDWVATKYEIDLTRTFTGGLSMGGSGSLMLAIRHPERVAWAVSWVGIHRPLGSPTYKSSYETVYGAPELGVKFEEGTPVWEYFDDATYLRRHPDRHIPFITFSNGKNDTGIGWPQAVEFFRALQETRQPHLFVWGGEGHSQRALMPRAGGQQVMPLDLQIKQSVPAFTKSSLDDDPGSGPAESGAPAGQVNLYLDWRTNDIVDQADRWEMTVGVIDESPRDVAVVDVTPRRTQQFTVAPGERVSWTNTPLGKREPTQRGEAVADRWGLVTLERLEIGKGHNRLQVRRANAASSKTE